MYEHCRIGDDSKKMVLLIALYTPSDNKRMRIPSFTSHTHTVAFHYDGLQKLTDKQMPDYRACTLFPFI